MYITRMTITEEDKRAIMELQHEANKKAKLLDAARESNASSEEYNRAFDEYNKVSRKLFDLREAIRKRYVTELSQDKAKALQNAADILEAYTREDYRKEAAQAHAWAEEKLMSYRATFEQFPEYRDIPEIKKEYEYYKEVKATSYRNFKGAYTRLSFITKDEREALILGGHGTEELDTLIYNRAATFYKPNKHEARSDGKSVTPPLGNDGNYILQAFADSDLIPFYNGPMTNIFASVSTKGIQPGRRGDMQITKQSGRSSFTYTLTSDDTGNKILSRLTPSTKKLFFRIIQTFTAANPYSPEENTPLNPVVKINLKDFARVCGVPISAVPQNSQEAMNEEAARAEIEFNNFRRKVKDNMNILYRISVDGTEPGKGKTPDVRFRLLEHIDTRARGGYFTCELTQRFASYLANAYVLQGSEALYSLPDTNPNCFSIGLKLSSHSSIRNNIIQGTADIIGVKTLLEAASDIQSYEALVESNNRNWKRCIREPLEAALEANVDCGVITEWYYCGSKGTRISDAELDSKTYADYEALYVHFTMAGNREKLIETAKAKGGSSRAKKKTRSKKL